MHKNEPRVNSILITHTNKVYGLRVRTTKTHRSKIIGILDLSNENNTNFYKKYNI